MVQDEPVVWLDGLDMSPAPQSPDTILNALQALSPVDQAALARLSAQNSKQCTTCETDPEQLSFWVRHLKTAFYNGLEAAFDGLATEPKKILIVGGCRQWPIARRLGFMLPYSKITVLDPVAEIANLAEQMIHCRFDFDHHPLDQLPYGDETFDLTLALNVEEFLPKADDTKALTKAWDGLSASLCRVTRHNLVMSRVWGMSRGLSEFLPMLADPFASVGEELGFADIRQLPAVPDPVFRTPLKEFGKQTALAYPVPWELTTWQKQSASSPT